MNDCPSGAASESRKAFMSFTDSARASWRRAKSRSAAARADCTQVPAAPPTRATTASAAQRHGDAVAADELRDPVAQRHRRARQSARGQLAPQVVGERRHRGVALGRRLLQRRGDDGVEVAAQRPAQAIGARAARLGDRRWRAAQVRAGVGGAIGRCGADRCRRSRAGARPGCRAPARPDAARPAARRAARPGHRRRSRS